MESKLPNTIAIHGFLGTPNDWQPLIELGAELKAHSLYDDRLVPFEQWALEFNKKYNGSKTLVGYSLGGRLALNAFFADNSSWKNLVILSAHPGLKDDLLKKDRINHDEAWAKRFRRDDWNKLMADWNSQGVLNSSTKVDRSEMVQFRSILADQLNIWSLGRMNNFREQIARYSNRITWLVGEKDEKFLKLAKELELGSQLHVIKEQGHRLITSQQAMNIVSNSLC